MRFMVYALKQDPETLATARKVLDRLRGACGNRVLAKKLGIRACAKADIIVTIGGDGTILAAAREHPDSLIFGIHRGEVGFLSEIGASELEKLDALVLGKYSVEARARVSGFLSGKKIGDGLNELVVTSSRPAAVIVLAIGIDGTTYGPFSADGVIISTPTGSTAYSMSAGGPVVDPACKVLNIVPVCPYTNGAKPLVVHDSAKISVKVLKGAGVIALDGRVVRKMGQGENVLVEKAGSDIRFIRLKKHFYRKINEMCR